LLRTAAVRLPPKLLNKWDGGLLDKRRLLFRLEVLHLLGNGMFREGHVPYATLAPVNHRIVLTKLRGRHNCLFEGLVLLLFRNASSSVTWKQVCLFWVSNLQI